MSTMLGVDNAIGWAHWQVRGGWKNTLLTTGAYFLGMSTLIYFTVRANPLHQSDVLSAWRVGLLALQTGFLVLFAGSRVCAAVRGDINSRMIESHRLMPVEPIVAVSGYLWGPTSQGVALAVATLVIGGVITSAAGIEIALWFGPNIVLAIFALFAWIVAAFASSITKAAAGLLVAIVLSIWFSMGQVLWLLPGMMLLLTPMSGKTIYTTRSANGEFTWPMIIAVLMQALIAVPLYIGAARKYRRSEDTALAVMPGLMLLAGWVAASTFAIGNWDSYFPENLLRRDMSQRSTTMFVVSMASAMLLALAPVANAARDRRWRDLSILVAVVAAAIILGQCLAMRDWGAWKWEVGATAIVLVSFTVAVCFVLRTVYRVSARGWPIALGWIILMWLIPLAIDTIRWALSLTQDQYQMSVMAGCSPIGALIIIWDDRLDIRIAIPGLLFQGCCALAWVIIFHTTQRRRRIRSDA